MRILIVDDELVSREKLRKIMADFGECIVVDNGTDALKIATSQAPPDLILLDIIMPEMDGYEVCKRLKAERSTSDIPVIFITSKQDEDDENKGLGLGAGDYIRKPFSTSIVKARVRTHLELKKHRNRLEEIVNGRTVELEKATKEMQVEIAERKQAEEALRKSHDELEWRVKERTGELIKMNEQLKVEIEERKHAEEELRLVSSSLLKAQERERKRISLELHDELGQSLLALKLQISFIEKGLEEGQAELRSDCQAMLDQIVGLIGHVRRICKDLSPVILDDLGLTAGIRWLVENALKSHDIDTSLDIVNIDKLLTNEQQLLVFRIFQETFTNIVRHSCSSLTSIIIRKQGGEISFVIEDNGKGFDVKEAMGRDLAKRGMGLSSMEERAWMLGGSVNIWSQRDLGTRIEFRVRIEQPEKT